MKIFGWLYKKAMLWSRHAHASRYLVGLSFTEASFFPIPPDVMLAPMVLAQRQKAWRLAAITTIASVLGGIFGYFIGMYLYVQIGEAVVAFYHAEETFAEIKSWFDSYGVWVILLASFTPIPYKLFTITAGVVSMAIIPFILLSLLGRSARFFLVAGMIYFGGERLEGIIKKYIDLLGWSLVVIVAILYFWLIR